MNYYALFKNKLDEKDLPYRELDNGVMEIIQSGENLQSIHTTPDYVYGRGGLYYAPQDTNTAFLIWPMAFFSSRDTWAWEMPTIPATSIWVLPS